MTNEEVIRHYGNLESLQATQDELKAEKEWAEKKYDNVARLVRQAERVHEVFEGVALTQDTGFGGEKCVIGAAGDDIERAATVEKNAPGWTKEPRYELRILNTAGYHRRTRFKFDGLAAAVTAAKVFVATGKSPDETTAPLPLKTLEAIMAALPPESPLRGDVYSLIERHYPWL